MVHIKTISLRKADVSDKGIDAGGAIFLQIWAAVFTWILTGAFSSKR